MPAKETLVGWGLHLLSRIHTFWCVSSRFPFYDLEFYFSAVFGVGKSTVRILLNSGLIPYKQLSYSCMVNFFNTMLFACLNLPSFLKRRFDLIQRLLVGSSYL